MNRGWIADALMNYRVFAGMVFVVRFQKNES